MRRVPRLLSASDAAALIADGQTVASTGFSMIGVAEDLYRAIEARYLADGHPRDLTLVHSAGQSDRTHCMKHWAQPGLLVAPGDPDALSEALRAWLGDRELRRRLRRAARERRESLKGWSTTASAVAAALAGASP